MAGLLLCVLTFALCVGLNHSVPLIDVVQHGAKGDGQSDDTQSFKDAWDAACTSSEPSPTLYFPGGKTFFLQPLTFEGPCKPQNISFQIDGNIVAPSDPYSWKFQEHNCDQWIKFHKINGLFIHGFGTITGRGFRWWSISNDDLGHDFGCNRKPSAFRIANCNNMRISGLKFEDNPLVHIAIEKSTQVYISDLTIKAPGNSPNTDGINIQQSSDISIINSQIGTGDDCISIVGGTSHVNVSNVACGPGHGISIGSLGKDGENDTVEYVHVKNCSFKGTTNGVRIKTWQGGNGYARYIIFEDIKSYASSQPILIDQYYCPHSRCKNQTSAVHIDNVVYSNVNGTALYTQDAIRLACSESVPCTGIVMKNIDLKPSRHRKSIKAYCLNVRGYKNGQVFPDVSCLQKNNHVSNVMSKNT